MKTRRPRPDGVTMLGAGSVGRSQRSLAGWWGDSRAIPSPDTSARCTASQTLVLADFPDPKLARALSPNGRAHWATKKRARDIIEWIVGQAIFEQRLTDELLGRQVRITYRWVLPDRRRRDLDNHSTGVVKVVQDCLVRLGLIDADDTSCVVGISTEIVYERGARRLEITVAPATPGSGVEGE